MVIIKIEYKLIPYNKKERAVQNLKIKTVIINQIIFWISLKYLSKWMSLEISEVDTHKPSGI